MKKFLPLLLTPFLFSGCYLTTVDSTETGVKKEWSEVQSDPVYPGIAFNMMPGTDLFIMRTANKVANFIGTTDGVDSPDELNNPSILVMTEQNLQVPLDISVMYQLNPQSAPQMLAQFGPDTVWDNMLITKEVNSSVRDAVGKTSLTNLNIQREEYEKKIHAMLSEKLQPYGVAINSVAIRNVAVPETIKQAILAKETERENAEKAKYAVERANEEAKIEIAKAKGVAEANNILANSLTNQLVQYKQLEIQASQIEKWNGVMPTTIVGNETTPLINIK